MTPSLLRQVSALIHGRLKFILPALLAAAGMYGFLELADEVAEGDVREADEWVLLSMRNPDDLADPVGPRWVEEMMRDFTALGGIGVSTLVTAGAACYLLLVGKRAMAVYLAAAVVGGVVVCLALKSGYDRPRPDLAPHGSIVYTRSFPSGHATTAATVYLTLGAMLARVQRRRTVKVFIGLMAVAVTLLVGVSRVYLAVHWPTDVVAGWALGTAWALIAWLVATAIATYFRTDSTPLGHRVAEEMSDDPGPR